jgi:hypothetical protein
LELTFCCPACRLLQAPGTECIECGQPIGEIAASASLLHYRIASDVTRKKTEIGSAVAGVGVATAASIAGLTLLGPIGWAALPIIAYTSLVTTGAIASMRARRYRRIVAVDVDDPAIGDGAIIRTGIARALTGPVSSRLDDTPILAEQVVIRDGGSIYLRRVQSTPFVISSDADPDELAILGELRLATRRHHRAQGRRSDVREDRDPAGRAAEQGHGRRPHGAPGHHRRGAWCGRGCDAPGARLSPRGRAGERDVRSPRISGRRGRPVMSH